MALCTTHEAIYYARIYIKIEKIKNKYQNVNNYATRSRYAFVQILILYLYYLRCKD